MTGVGGGCVACGAFRGTWVLSGGILLQSVCIMGRGVAHGLAWPSRSGSRRLGLVFLAPQTKHDCGMVAAAPPACPHYACLCPG